MKNRFSSSKSKKNYYNWFSGDAKSKPSEIKTYKLSDEELHQLINNSFLKNSKK